MDGAAKADGDDTLNPSAAGEKPAAERNSCDSWRSIDQTAGRRMKKSAASIRLRDSADQRALIRPSLTLRMPDALPARTLRARRKPQSGWTPGEDLQRGSGRSRRQPGGSEPLGAHGGVVLLARTSSPGGVVRLALHTDTFIRTGIRSVNRPWSDTATAAAFVPIDHRRLRRCRLCAARADRERRKGSRGAASSRDRDRLRRSAGRSNRGYNFAAQTASSTSFITDP